MLKERIISPLLHCFLRKITLLCVFSKIYLLIAIKYTNYSLNLYIVYFNYLKKNDVGL